MILTNLFRIVFFASLALVAFPTHAYSQEFENNYNPFTGQTNTATAVIYSNTPYSYKNHNPSYYHVYGTPTDSYSFCYHNGQAYSEGSIIKRKKCVKSGFPNSPMSWEKID